MLNSHAFRRLNLLFLPVSILSFAALAVREARSQSMDTSGCQPTIYQNHAACAQESTGESWVYVNNACYQCAKYYVPYQGSYSACADYSHNMVSCLYTKYGGAAITTPNGTVDVFRGASQGASSCDHGICKAM